MFSEKYVFLYKNLNVLRRLFNFGLHLIPLHARVTVIIHFNFIISIDHVRRASENNS